MTVENFIKGGNIVREATSATEIRELFMVAARSMKDARASGLSQEGRFALAYDAAIELSTIPVRAAGYRTRGEGHHWVTFSLLVDLMGEIAEDVADYFQTCRTKRSTAIYRHCSVVTNTEADALIQAVGSFEKRVRSWLEMNYPDLLK